MSKEFVPYLNVTTQLDDTPDADLLSDVGGSGFPTMVFLEPETGAVLTEHYWRPSSAEEAREQLAEANAEAADLKRMIGEAEANPDDEALQAGLQIKLALMHATEASLDELLELSKTEGLAPEIKAEFEGWYVDQRVQEIMESAGDAAESRDEWMEICSKGFYDLLKDGARLPADNQTAQAFYEWGMNHAIEVGDAETARAAFLGYKEALELIAEQSPEYAEQVDGMIADAHERLEGLGAEEGSSEE